MKMILRSSHAFVQPLFIAVAAVSVLLTVLTPLPAAAHEARQSSENQFCVMVVGKPADSTSPSPELYHYCSTKSIDDARAHLASPTARAELGRTVAASDLLMTWFTDRDYGGGQTDIFGYEGTCDTAGYRLAPNSYWRVRISSAAGFAQCNYADFVNIAKNYADGFGLPINYIGNTLNDNVGTIQVYHA
ncbi:MAG: hypothetical protein H7Y15_12870 [Pseudonocardia sp.]|nr:hypothetical protein [Pseudonocardia sp.]